jgi:hypothetical protein
MGKGKRDKRKVSKRGIILILTFMQAGIIFSHF